MQNKLDVELDPAFAARDALRRAGMPVEIAATERLLIRETVLKDIPVFYSIFRENGREKLFSPVQPTLEEEMEYMRAYIVHAYAFYDFGLWTVLERQSGEIVGQAGLCPTALLCEGVELGYRIDKRCRRRGYAKEAGKAILDYAFRTLELPEVHLLTDEQNLPSIRTAEALGFRLLEEIEKQKLRHYIRFADFSPPSL